ncbi:sulfatase-like hydrolase/transferase [Roseimaritima ulvae]|uniref:Choline-sulfatase n=1 Tax=Roseimaritima ulvae TaxID=980254 RepID=A0A5B9R5K2_9BACT|nr:sulfatase-like hydrolase/transferase [Roseimaritima ulvae]QEG41801.1 Choline-sulfatase [Roseimaritima ulvae]
MRLAFVILLVLVNALAGAVASAADRPNVVMIISDDQTYCDFGFMGHPLVRTPHLDRLAAESARYPNGYVPSSVCRPSLVTLLTGLYPHQHGVHFNHPPPGFAKLTKSPEIDKQRYDELRNDASQRIGLVPTLPRLLAERGYRCLQTGKYWEGHWRNAGFTEGMTIAEPTQTQHGLGNKRLANGDIVAHGNGDRGLTIGRKTMQPIFDFIGDCQQKDDPFLVWYAPFLPHLPHDAPERFRKLYESDPHVPRHAIPYYATCTWFDATVGQLIAHIEKSGLAENTVFVFVVDNGFTPDPQKPMADGDFNYTKTSKRSPFDEGLRTPILIRWDGHTEVAEHVNPCSSVDIVPTVLDALGIEDVDGKFPGRSLWPSAVGAELLRAEPVFGAIYPGDATSLGHPERDVAYRWIRSGRFKLIVPHGKSSGKPWGNYLDQPTLFDVVSDPHEQTDLADREHHADTLRHLKQQLDQWWTPTDAPGAK